MFLDTSGLLCYHHRSEPQHKDAVAFFLAASTRFTHNYVIAEFVALAQARGLPRGGVLDFVAELHGNPAVEVAHVDIALHQSGLDLLRQTLDKAWSVLDSVRFLVLD